MRHRAWLALAVTGLLLAGCGQIAEAPDTTEPTLGQLAIPPDDTVVGSGEDSGAYWKAALGLGDDSFWRNFWDGGDSDFVVPAAPEGFVWKVAIVRSGEVYHIFHGDPDLEAGDVLDTGGSWNVAFLFKEVAEDAVGGEWCSPGFWRNNPMAADDAAEAGGFAVIDLYSALIGPIAIENERQATRLGASADPTLWEVLQMPQVYGGDAFNAVGDLLSAWHPEVDFVYGERVEDSCPLSADASHGGTTGP